MRILYLTHEYVPQATSGIVSSTHEECLALSSCGDNVFVLSELSRYSNRSFYFRDRIRARLQRKSITADSTLGYTVLRGVDVESQFVAIVKQIKPDVVVAHPTGLRSRGEEVITYCHANGIPITIYYSAMTAFDRTEHRVDCTMIKNSPVLTVSRYMARELQHRLSLADKPEYVLPIVWPEKYRTEREPRYVLFVNPTPAKGLPIALELAARRQDIRFLFVQSWSIRADRLRNLLSNLRSLPNVTLLPPTDDMRPVYRGAKLVLAPSAMEAWGRVATEAHVSGIPVLGTAGHGLEEAVGPGGILIKREDGVEAWERGLSLLWDDPEIQQMYSAAAAGYSLRSEIRPSESIARLRKFLKRVAAQR